MRRFRIVLASVTMSIVVIVASVAVASAAIPDSSGTIHGCRNTVDGTLKVIDTTTTPSCPKGYAPLDWSQSGLSHYTRIISGISLPPRATGITHVLCGEGLLAVSGGYESNGQISVYISRPTDDNFYWRYGLINQTDRTIYVGLYVTCVAPENWRSPWAG